jgi:hypothetical protein
VYMRGYLAQPLKLQKVRVISFQKHEGSRLAVTPTINYVVSKIIAWCATRL